MSKKQGFCTGRIYDFDDKNIHECCQVISDEENTEELNKKRHEKLKLNCILCPGDKDCLK